MIVLGLHRDPWHNTGAALIRDDGGTVRLNLISEERLDRVKDSRAFPVLAIESCMRDAGVQSIEDIDIVVLDYIRVPDWRRDEFKRTAIKNAVLDKIDPARIHVINHHLAHACSTYFSSIFPDAAILIVDGRGSDNETQSLFDAEGHSIRRVEHTDTIGIGLMYAAVTQAIGFGLLQEGKTMGLAPYGRNLPGPILKIGKNYNGIVTDYADFCVEGDYSLRNPIRIDSFDEKARAAFDAQKECEEALLHLARHAKEVTGRRRLCLSGGVALNSVANDVIRNSGIFEEVFINPACSDTGIPLGTALYGYHVIADRPRFKKEISPYIGPLYGKADIEKAVSLAEGRCEIFHDRVLERTADLLAANKIIGHVHGRSEMGPRALGNRSILMSPLKAENKDVLNARVKHREAFRPFAPACLEERASEFFEIDCPSPYMLLVPFVREEKREIIPAVTHADGTGRLQTVNESDNARFRRLIELFEERTGVPVLLNTSFNDNGEPIVETPTDAVRCFLKVDLDALLLDDTLMIKRA